MRGDRLRHIRLQRGYSQSELAGMLDIGNKQIWRYENQETTPDSETAARIARLLGTSADYLLGLTDDPSPRTLPEELSTKERAALVAWRSGEKLRAIEIIVND